ncbi:low-density lipoprotein receptor class A domain-containing protein 4 isoform X1 [Mastomys coucha]|uniref:low-density lipoprotein receptor class A domain-containing protein 4 isoform X1 n=1 Tax=Mastomys coucha TaxID=35658 RepID=UPI001261ADE4|nr:low-density lipoprotein receptor class A domain-containing protein 4 isoform X1 [Mastomys coucha]XP_031221819.1 low-density lipoprotein receptor class A domain-containing protein 4 isoform X1 [Mastomys coucha]
MPEAGFQATNAFTECKFTCTSGKCLYLGSLVCNQQNDCGDNSDEENCLLVTEHPPPGIFNSELEFAQVLIIVVVVTVMVVVVVCLLNHYKVSTRSFINRPNQSQRQEDGLQPEGSLWPSDSSVQRPGTSEIMCAPRGRDRFTTPSFIQRDPFSRFQPTYPYVQHEIDLPPTISLSDGEEPPPYQGPCTLQLRDPEQQMELNRESVRAPPNRTVFDSDLIDISMYNGGPCPPSSHSGISAATCSSNGRMEGPPPTYSEVMGHYPGTSFFHHQHSNGHRGSRPQFQPNNSEGTIVPIKGKDRKPGDLV